MKLQRSDGYYYTSSDQNIAWAILRNKCLLLLNHWIERANCTDVFNVILVGENEQPPSGAWSITVEWNPYIGINGFPPSKIDAFPDANHTELTVSVNSDKTQVWWTLNSGLALTSIPSPPVLPITHAGIESALSHELGHALGLAHHWASSNVMYSDYRNNIYPQFDERKTLYELYHPGNYYHYCNVTNQFGGDPGDIGGYYLYNGDSRWGFTTSQPHTMYYTSDDVPTLTALDNQKFPNSQGATYYYHRWKRDGGSGYLAIWTPTNPDYDIVPQTPNSDYRAMNESPYTILLTTGVTCVGTQGGSYIVHDGWDQELLNGLSGEFPFLYNRCNGSYTVEAIADQGYRFIRWSDGNETNPRQISEKANKTLYAVYTPHLLSNDPVSTLESAGPTSINSQRKITSIDNATGDILYHQVYTACGNVYYTNSTDDGATWSNEVPISLAGTPASNPSIFAEGDSVWIVWNNPGYGLGLVKFHYQDPVGSKWAYPISGIATPTDICAPVVVKTHDWANSIVFVFYEAGPEIYYALFCNGFLADNSQYSQQLATDMQKYPSASVRSNSEVELVWNDDDKVWYRSSTINWVNNTPILSYLSQDEIVDLAGMPALGAPSIAPNEHNSGMGLGSVVASETGIPGLSSGVTITMQQYAGWSNPQTFCHITEDGRLWAPSVGQIDITPTLNAFENLRMGVNFTYPTGNPVTKEVHLIQAYPWGGQVLYQIHNLSPTADALHPAVTQQPTFRSGLTMFSELSGGGLSNIESSPTGFKKSTSQVVAQAKELHLISDTSRIVFGLSDLEVHTAGAWQPVEWVHKADTTVLGKTRTVQEEFRTTPFSCASGMLLRYVAQESRAGYHQLPANLKVYVQAVDAITNNVLAQIALFQANQTAPGRRRSQITQNIGAQAGRSIYLRLSLSGLDTTVSLLAHDIWMLDDLDTTVVPKYAENAGISALQLQSSVDELYQNWPNPFNPTSTIKYYLSQSGTVQLAVYDLVGRERAVLQSGYIEAGLHSVVFDATQLASGTYYYNLRTERGTLQRSLNILK